MASLSFVEDVAQLRQVLERNNISKEDVGEDVLIALLEQHASDEQRIDFVLLDLQDLLGKELAVGHLGEKQGSGAAHHTGRGSSASVCDVISSRRLRSLQQCQGQRSDDGSLPSQSLPTAQYFGPAGTFFDSRRLFGGKLRARH